MYIDCSDSSSLVIIYVFLHFQLRHELDRVISERDRLLAESSELGADKATRESERAALRAELREARQREQRLLLDIGDLEDENISLQKQVSALRSSQVITLLYNYMGQNNLVFL